MSRFGRIHRQPDHFSSAHERARARAAERIDGPLGLAETTWLEEHLAGCPACAAIAASYESDRLALRALRDASPEPPRDLWARTAAGIDAAAGTRGPGGIARERRPARRIPLGAMSGLAVIAVVVGVSAVSSGLLGGGAATASLSTAEQDIVVPEAASGGTDANGPDVAGVQPTPFAVGAGDVQWVRTGSDGSLALNAAPIDQVCPEAGKEGCGTLDDAAARELSIAARPRTIIGSPVDGQAVVVTDNASGSDDVLVMSLPAAGSPAPFLATPSPSAPGASASPDAPSTDPTEVPASADPGATSEPAATPVPTTGASGPPEASAPPTASPSPEPTTAVSLAIASGVQVVGESAAFSADGTWFAFTARPADGSSGPDIYVWKVGEPTARRLTDDGASTFASWSGDAIVASRPAERDTSGGGEAVISPSSVTIDPVTGTATDAASAWRPAVDPTGTRAVVWSGTIAADPDGSWRPADGRLELRAWPDAAEATDGGVQVVAEGPLADFDVRWDEAGAWFAVWVTDPTDPALGRLTLFGVDPATGLLVQPEGAPVDVPAQSGFSIGQGRLAWATPPGQGGEGSRVQVVAWAGDGVGTVETTPGEDLVVIR